MADSSQSTGSTDHTGTAISEPLRSPADVPSDNNPYLELRRILHGLWLLAMATTDGQCAFDQINSTTEPWDAAESLARCSSAAWGIPFSTFDPVLVQAKLKMRELVQVAAGNTSVPFSAFDYQLGLLNERLQDLANSVTRDTGAEKTTKRAIDSPTTKKAKRSTQKGEARDKLIAALTKHHNYADGGCLNLEPIGNNELARLAGVSESTASGFFNNQFGGHTKYQAICGDATRLVSVLKLLNQEFAPHHLFGAKPPGEDEREDDE